MARTNLTEKELRNAVFDKTKLEALQAKLAEHDTAVDALEGGTTSTVVTIHPVRAASTTNIANLAACSTTMDTSITLVAGDRVLLKDQSTPAQNGVYVVGTVGGGTAPLTRATDFDASAEVKPNTIVAVSAGTANANTIWQLTVATAPTIGSTSLPFVQIVNKTQLATYLALTTQAGLIGSDAAGYTATTVKAQLAEVKTIADAASPAATLALTTTPGGASYVGVFDTAGYYTATNVETILAEIGPKLIAKKTVTVDEEALTGTSQAVNVGTALPANAVVLAHEIVVNEQGALAGNDLTITLGGTTANAIVASTDLDALGVGSYQGTLGTHPRGSFSSEQLVATFAASDLASLSAGNWTFNVWYMVLA